jgi:hypothetical protein
LDTGEIRCNPVAKRKAQHVVIDLDEPAKGTHPVWSPSESWYIRFRKLNDPLTRKQSEMLRRNFGWTEEQSRQLRQLKRDWKKISAVAQYVALCSAIQATTTKLFSGKGMKRARDTQLREAIRASEAASKAVERMTTLWTPLLSTGGLQLVKLRELHNWADTVIARLADERKAMKHHGTLPTAKVKTGRPEEPETYRLKILASYFRYRRWDVSSEIESFFSLICSAVLTGSERFMNPTRLKAVVNSDYSYEALLPFADPSRSSRALVRRVTLRRVSSKK